MKHTPGPWQAKSNIPASTFSWMVYNKEYSSWPIAIEAKKEDAHLIAAAPEMYEALNLIYNLHCDGYFSLPDEKYIAITKIASAIAKAEGRQTE